MADPEAFASNFSRGECHQRACHGRNQWRRFDRTGNAAHALARASPALKARSNSNDRAWPGQTSILDEKTNVLPGVPNLYQHCEPCREFSVLKVPETGESKWQQRRATDQSGASRQWIPQSSAKLPARAAKPATAAVARRLLLDSGLGSPGVPQGARRPNFDTAVQIGDC